MEQPSFLPDLQRSSSNRVNNASQPSTPNLNTPSSHPPTVNPYLCHQHTTTYPQLGQHATNNTLSSLPHFQMFSDTQNILLPLHYYNFHPIQSLYHTNQLNFDDPTISHSHSSPVMMQSTATHAASTSLPFASFTTPPTNTSNMSVFGFQPSQERHAQFQQSPYIQTHIQPVQTPTPEVTPHLQLQHLQPMPVSAVVSRQFTPILPSTTPRPTSPSAMSHPNRRYNLPGQVHQNVSRAEPSVNVVYAEAPTDAFDPLRDLAHPLLMQSQSATISQQDPVEPRSSPRGPIVYSPPPYLVQNATVSDGTQPAPVFRHRLSRSAAVPHPLPENPRSAPFSYRPVSDKGSKSCPSVPSRQTQQQSASLSAGFSRSDKSFHVQRPNDLPKSTSSLPFTAPSHDSSRYVHTTTNMPILPTPASGKHVRDPITTQATSQPNQEFKSGKSNDGEREKRLPLGDPPHSLPIPDFLKQTSQPSPPTNSGPEKFSATGGDAPRSPNRAQLLPDHLPHPSSSISLKLQNTTISPKHGVSCESAGGRRNTIGLETLVAAIREVDLPAPTRTAAQVIGPANTTVVTSSPDDMAKTSGKTSIAVPSTTPRNIIAGRGARIVKKLSPPKKSRSITKGDAPANRSTSDVPQHDHKIFTGSEAKATDPIFLANETVPAKSTVHASLPARGSLPQKKKQGQESACLSTDKTDANVAVPGNQGGKSITLPTKNYAPMRSASSLTAPVRKSASPEVGKRSDTAERRPPNTTRPDTATGIATNRQPTGKSSPSIDAKNLKKRIRSVRRRNRPTRMNRMTDVNAQPVSKATAATEDESPPKEVLPSFRTPNLKRPTIEKQCVNACDTSPKVPKSNTPPSRADVLDLSSLNVAATNSSKPARVPSLQDMPSPRNCSAAKPPENPNPSRQKNRNDVAPTRVLAAEDVQTGNVDSGSGMKASENSGSLLSQPFAVSSYPLRTLVCSSAETPKDEPSKANVKESRESNQTVQDVEKFRSVRLPGNPMKPPQSNSRKQSRAKSSCFPLKSVSALPALPVLTPCRDTPKIAALPAMKIEDSMSSIAVTEKPEHGSGNELSRVHVSKAGDAAEDKRKSFLKEDTAKNVKDLIPPSGKKTSPDAPVARQSDIRVGKDPGDGSDGPVSAQRPSGLNDDSLIDDRNKSESDGETLQYVDKLQPERDSFHRHGVGPADGGNTILGNASVDDSGTASKERDVRLKVGPTENLEIETHSGAMGHSKGVRRNKERTGVFAGMNSNSEDFALLNPPVLSALPASSPTKPVLENENSFSIPSTPRRSSPSKDQSPVEENISDSSKRTSTANNLKETNMNKIQDTVTARKDNSPSNESVDENIVELETTLSQKVKMVDELAGYHVVSRKGNKSLKSVLRSSQQSTVQLDPCENVVLGDSTAACTSEKVIQTSLGGRNKSKKVRFSIEGEMTVDKFVDTATASDNPKEKIEAGQNVHGSTDGENTEVGQKCSNVVSSPGSSPMLCVAVEAEHVRPKTFLLPLRLRLRNGKEVRSASSDDTSDERNETVILEDSDPERIGTPTENSSEGAGSASVPPRLSALDLSAFSLGPVPSFSIPLLPTLPTPCPLCGTTLKYGNIFTHPLFPTRLVKICGDCRQIVLKKVMGDSNRDVVPSTLELDPQKAAIFVAVVEQLVISMRPSDALENDAMDAMNTLKCRKRAEFKKRIETLRISYDMISIACNVLGKTGLAIENGRARWKKQQIEAKCDECAERVMSSWPVTIEDMMCGTCRGERAWTESFPTIPIGKGTRSCVILENILNLIGIEVESKCCRHDDVAGMCKLVLNAGSMMGMTHAAASVARDVNIKALFADNWNKKEALRTLSAEDFAILVEKEDISAEMDGCCICGSVHNGTKFPLRFAECRQCWRRFCSSCIVHVIGATEYTQVMCGTDYKCPLCRFRGNENLKMCDTEVMSEARAESIGRKELDIGNRIRKKRDVRKVAGILHLLPTVRRELLLHGLENHQYPAAVGAAKTWELMNDQLLSGTRNLNREEYEKICLKCKCSSVKRGDENDTSEGTGNLEEMIECGVAACGNFIHVKCGVEGTGTLGRRRGSRGKWTCGQHQCVECDQKDDSKLVKCLTCATALCMDHMAEMDDLFVINDRGVICQKCQEFFAKPKKFTANGATGSTGRRMNASLKSRMQVAMAIDAGQRAGMLRSVLNDR